MNQQEAKKSLEKNGCVYATSSLPMYTWNNRKIKRIERVEELQEVCHLMEPYYKYPAEYSGFETKETVLREFGDQEVSMADHVSRRLKK